MPTESAQSVQASDFDEPPLSNKLWGRSLYLQLIGASSGINSLLMFKFQTATLECPEWTAVQTCNAARQRLISDVVDVANEALVRHRHQTEPYWCIVHKTRSVDVESQLLSYPLSVGQSDLITRYVAATGVMWPALIEFIREHNLVHLQQSCDYAVTGDLIGVQSL